MRKENKLLQLIVKEREHAIIMDEERELAIIYNDEEREQSIIMDKEREQAIVYNGLEKRTSYYNNTN